MFSANFRVGRAVYLARRKRKFDARNEAVILMWRDGVRGRIIAARFGLSHQQVRHIISASGHTRWKRKATSK
jgi:transposase